jgi:uncharacterized protein YndB with AHSA1/START domain
MNKLGDFKKNNDGYQVIFERVYDHDVKKVWDALTDPAKMTKWFTDIEWDFRPGGKITFIFQDEARSKSYGKIVTIQEQKLLEFIWESEDENGPHEFARWELFNEGPAKTRLVLTYSRLIDDLAINVATGWHVVLDDFGDFLNGRTEFDAFGGSEPTKESKEIKERYTELFNQVSNNNR